MKRRELPRTIRYFTDARGQFSDNTKYIAHGPHDQAWLITNNNTRVKFVCSIHFSLTCVAAGDWVEVVLPDRVLYDTPIDPR